MIDDEVELRPVRGRLHQVVGVPVIRRVVRPARLGSRCRQSLVDADVEEPRMLPELVPVRVDDRVGGIGDHLVIQPPLGEFGPGEGAGRVRNAVALPRVRLAVLDLPLRVVAEGRVFQVPHAGVDLRVGEGPPRARQRVDEVPALRGLIAGQDLADRQTMPQTAGAQRTRGFGGRPKPSRCAKRRSDRSSKPWPTPTRCRPCRSPDSLAVSRDSPWAQAMSRARMAAAGRRPARGSCRGGRLPEDGNNAEPRWLGWSAGSPEMRCWRAERRDHKRRADKPLGR